VVEGHSLIFLQARVKGESHGRLGKDGWRVTSSNRPARSNAAQYTHFRLGFMFEFLVQARQQIQRDDYPVSSGRTGGA
jgi:hypothetical protein